MSRRFALCVIDVKRALVASVLSCLIGVVLATTAVAQPFRPDVAPPPPAPAPSTLTPTTPPSSAPAPPAAHATNEPVYFGLTADTVQRGRGAEVLAVDPQSPADRAGIRTGDVIERCNRQPTPTVELLGKAIGRLKVNQEISLEVRREGILIELKLTPTLRPAAIPSPPINAAPLLGVIALPVDPFAAALAGLPIRNGAVVDDIVAGTPAALARLPLGSIIVGLDDVAIDTPDQLRKVVAEKRPGDMIRLHYYEGVRLREIKLRLAARDLPEALLRPPVPADREARLDELEALRLERQRIEQRIQQLEAELK